MNTIDPLQHATLMPHIMFSFSEKYITEQRGNWQQPTNKPEQVAFGMKQRLTFQIWSFV